MANPLIRKIYLYLFSLIGLVLITIGTVRLVDLGLKVFVFKDADTFFEFPVRTPDGEKTETPEEVKQMQRSSQRQRDAAGALAQIIVGLPLYLYHWSVIKKEKAEQS